MLKYALHGELAQLVERQDRTLEASGSIPLFSIACFFCQTSVYKWWYVYSDTLFVISDRLVSLKPN